MKNIFKLIAGVLVFGGTFLVSCTDLESVSVDVVNVPEQNPEAYANYLNNLLTYKASDHNMVYAFFDNSNKEPFSPGQHVTSVPDSVDVIAVMTPALADFEVSDMASVREKGTKVFFYVSYDNIKAEYDNLGLTSSFSDYLQTQLTEMLSYSSYYDGMVAGFSGMDPSFLTGSEYSEYQSAQNVFLNSVSSWVSSNSTKEVAFYGAPQNLIDRSLLSSCSYVILDSGSAASDYQLDLIVQEASQSNVPTDRFMMSASTVSLSSSDSDTGYWDGERALAQVAYWLTVEGSGYTKAGLAILNVQNDYYDTYGVYTYVRKAIDILNPSPAK